MMKIDIMTLFPEVVEAYLSESIIGRARTAGFVKIECENYRDYSTDKHNRVDDSPYGGGTGMIIGPQSICDCYQSICNKNEEKPYLIYMSPKGKTLNQRIVFELSKKTSIAILCGHYEGVDQRVIDEIVDEEISIGDYVVTGGEIPAIILTDAICRMIPGVLKNEDAFSKESHFDGLLEYPQYTRPPVWHEKKVPDVLLSGHHEKIAEWQYQQALKITKEKRPDLYEKYLNNKKGD